jgi:hypothetical protein
MANPRQQRQQRQAEKKKKKKVKKNTDSDSGCDGHTVGVNPLRHTTKVGC